MIRLKMRGVRHRILHIGGNTIDARMIREALSWSNSEPFDIDWVGKLSDGLERLTTNQVSAVLFKEIVVQ